MKMKKRGIVWSEIIWWIVGLILLAIVIIGIILSRTFGFNILDKFLNIFRFGR
jgi:hypothetical protein